MMLLLISLTFNLTGDCCICLNTNSIAFVPWWSAPRNWFSSTSKTKSLPAWTLTSMLSEPTDQQRMPYLPPFIQSSHNLRLGKSYIRMPFVDFSSASNIVSPMKLIRRLNSLGLSTSLCNWVLNLLTSSPQTFQTGSPTPYTLVLNSGRPQGCELVPHVFTSYIHDCIASI